MHKEVYERNELLRSAFMIHIGNNYKPDQLIFMDEFLKDERSLSREYGYSEINTRARKKNVFIRGFDIQFFQHFLWME